MPADALRRLIALDGEYQKLIDDARECLQGVDLPRFDHVVVVRIDDIVRALKEYEKGLLSERQLQEWADVIEMNDYVDYERGAEKAVADMLFRLSSPDINQPITRPVVRRMLASLEQ